MMSRELKVTIISLTLGFAFGVILVLSINTVKAAEQQAHGQSTQCQRPLDKKEK